jgi:hypothetical protein
MDVFPDRKEPRMKAVKPDSAEVRKHRKAMRSTFNGRSNPIVGISDAVQMSTTELSRSAHRAEKVWLRSLTRTEKSLLRQGRSLA